MNTLDTMFLAINNFITGLMEPGYGQAALLGFLEALQEMTHARIAEIGYEKFKAESEVIKQRTENSRLAQELADVRSRSEGRKYFTLEDRAVYAVVMDHIENKPGQKIEAIKLVRQMTNCGLKESKDYVETFKAYQPNLNY